MEKKEPKYTQEFKEQMVAQYKSGTPARELVQRYGMSKSTLHKWIGDYTRSGSFHAKDNRSPEENELIMLHKELKKLRMENDILKQAALIMAKKQPWSRQTGINTASVPCAHCLRSAGTHAITQRRRKNATRSWRTKS